MSIQSRDLVCKYCGRSLRECSCNRYEKEKAFLSTLERSKLTGYVDPEITFDTMRLFDPEDEAFLRNYALGFKSKLMGLLLSGGKGTGKTTAACCIVNALKDQHIAVPVFLPPLITASRIGEDGDNLANKMRTAAGFFPLLIIDDLGTERSSPYAVEQMFSFVDTRYQKKLPLIITTNLTPNDILDVAYSNADLSRVYQRILELAPIHREMSKDIRTMIIKERVQKGKEDELSTVAKIACEVGNG